MRRSIVTAVLTGALAVVAFGEEPAREGWSRVEAVPAWVLAPPHRDDFVRVVDAAQSNLLDVPRRQRRFSGNVSADQSVCREIGIGSIARPQSSFPW